MGRPVSLLDREGLEEAFRINAHCDRTDRCTSVRVGDGQRDLSLIALGRFIEFDFADVNTVSPFAVCVLKLGLIALPHVRGHIRGRNIEAMLIHHENLGDGTARGLDMRPQGIGGRVVQNAIDQRARGTADLGPPGLVELVNLRLIQSGIRSILRFDGGNDLRTIGPSADLIVQVSFESGVNSSAKAGTASRRAATVGTRRTSKLLYARGKGDSPIVWSSPQCLPAN